MTLPEHYTIYAFTHTYDLFVSAMIFFIGLVIVFVDIYNCTFRIPTLLYCLFAVVWMCYFVTIPLVGIGLRVAVGRMEQTMNERGAEYRRQRSELSVKKSL